LLNALSIGLRSGLYGGSSRSSHPAASIDRWTIATNKKKTARLPLTGVGVSRSTLEHPDDCNRVLGEKYHAVVGNPPYIVKDAALNKKLRGEYGTCHRQCSLGVPFAERFWDLCVAAAAPPFGVRRLDAALAFAQRVATDPALAAALHEIHAGLGRRPPRARRPPPAPPWPLPPPRT
jgi:hypothetical protein